jgi:hypothetical protein
LCVGGGGRRSRARYETHLVEGRDFIATLLQAAVDSGHCRLVDAPTIAETIVVIALHFAGPESDRSVGIGATDALAETYGVLMAGLRPAKSRASRKG